MKTFATLGLAALAAASPIIEGRGQNSQCKKDWCNISGYELKNVDAYKIIPAANYGEDSGCGLICDQEKICWTYAEGSGECRLYHKNL